jgi:hypothetical protein
MFDFFLGTGSECVVTLMDAFFTKEERDTEEGVVTTKNDLFKSVSNGIFKFFVLFVDHNRSTIGLLRPTLLEGTLEEVTLHLIEVYFIMKSSISSISSHPFLAVCV